MSFFCILQLVDAWLCLKMFSENVFYVFRIIYSNPLCVNFKRYTSQAKIDPRKNPVNHNPYFKNWYHKYLIKYIFEISIYLWCRVLFLSRKLPCRPGMICNQTQMSVSKMPYVWSADDKTYILFSLSLSAAYPTFSISGADVWIWHFEIENVTKYDADVEAGFGSNWFFRFGDKMWQNIMQHLSSNWQWNNWFICKMWQYIWSNSNKYIGLANSLAHL